MSSSIRARIARRNRPPKAPLAQKRLPDEVADAFLWWKEVCRQNPSKKSWTTEQHLAFAKFAMKYAAYMGPEYADHCDELGKEQHNRN